MAPMELVIGEDGVARCWWGASTPDYADYHDTEWGFGTTDDARLFEKICLEGFQSGLSWRTILAKRENFRAAFDGFDYHKVARYGEHDVARLLADAGIVRHRGKIDVGLPLADQIKHPRVERCIFPVRRVGDDDLRTICLEFAREFERIYYGDVRFTADDLRRLDRLADKIDDVERRAENRMADPTPGR